MDNSQKADCISLLSKKIPKQAKAKSRVRKVKITIKPKHKNSKPQTTRKIVRNRQKKIEKKASKNAKVIIEDKIPEQKPKDNSEVIFNPSTGCIACQEGRQGEGEKDCWGCRLTRLQKLQEIQPWNKKKEEQGGSKKHFNEILLIGCFDKDSICLKCIFYYQYATKVKTEVGKRVSLFTTCFRHFSD